jgi:glutamate-1-semialdehyde 2,1-aminomutase
VVTSGTGAVFSVHFGLAAPPRTYRDTLGASAEQFAAFRMGLLRNGVLVLPDGRWYVGAVHDDAELSVALDAVTAAIDGL